ncbi:MAG: hypothetical protein Q4G43_07540 [Mobilicoccus sp.]|nr:hypothetical protein [Mobilicoccus sp.]
MAMTQETVLEALQSHAAALADALGSVEAHAPVGPDQKKTVLDLVNRITADQRAWVGLLDDSPRAADAPEQAETMPTATQALRQASAELVQALRDSPLDRLVGAGEAAMSVADITRSCVHQLFLHRLDIERAGGDGVVLDALWCADGVDAALSAASRVPDDAAVEVEDRLVRVVASDVGVTWIAAMTHVTARHDGRRHARQGVRVAEHDPADGSVRPAAILTGSAQDLLCLAHGRPTLESPQRAGDARLLEEFVSVLTTHRP